MSDAAEKPPSEPAKCRMNVLFSAPGFEIPDPDSIERTVNADNTIFSWGGVEIARISPEVVVKYGTHVTATEAKSMLFVGENTPTLLVPKIFAYYTYGPIDRDIDDFGSLSDTYIFMSYIDGQSLDKVWDTYDEQTKQRVAGQLKGHIDELRGISSAGYIGSVGSGPVTDPIGSPFASEDAFNSALIDAYQSQAPKSHIKSYLTGLLFQNKHKIVFTHGDLRLANIMVNYGSVTGIVDWEFSGWYPEYWEFAKSLYVWKWQNDWTNYLLQVLQPYYFGHSIHSLLFKELW
ncbi:kinase-like protein [Aspergillus stella-maris]|uniref:kinase-like protein n=1 Tax=Aspergillus stella-maris TaxID=1810926 RepID=UPI003CCD1EB1